MVCIQHFTHTRPSNVKKKHAQADSTKERTPIDATGIKRLSEEETKLRLFAVYRLQHDICLKHLNVQVVYTTAKRRRRVQRHSLLQIDTRHLTSNGRYHVVILNKYTLKRCSLPSANTFKFTRNLSHYEGHLSVNYEAEAAPTNRSHRCVIYVVTQNQTFATWQFFSSRRADDAKVPALQ